MRYIIKLHAHYMHHHNTILYGDQSSLCGFLCKRSYITKFPRQIGILNTSNYIFSSDGRGLYKMKAMLLETGYLGPIFKCGYLVCTNTRRAGFSQDLTIPHIGLSHFAL